MTIGSRIARRACAVVLGLASIVTVPAFGAERDTQGIIEEILVTSRRVQESQQEIPVAVTAFTPENIEQIAPRTLRDFDGLMPNVRIGMNTAGPSAGAVFIRGLGYASRLTHKWGKAYVYLSTRDGYLHITPWERLELLDRLLCVVGNLTAPEAVELLREEVLPDSWH